MYTGPMRVLDDEALPALPAEARALLAEGIFSLYEVLGEMAVQVAYVLITDADEFYFLASDGSVVARPAGVLGPGDLRKEPVLVPAVGPVTRINVA